MKYEVIIFDADETLFDFQKSERFALKKTMLQFGIEYDEKYHLQAYQTVNQAVWREFEDGLMTQKTLKVERFRRFSARINAGFDAADFAKAYIKHLSNASFLFDDSLKLIQNLHGTYKLLIISNGLSDVQDNRIRKSVIGNFFENIVISEEVEVSKPDPKIFEQALFHINYSDKRKVLMVGDSLMSDIQGGINFGIDTCWFNPGKTENGTSILPTYEISDLLKLNDILAQSA